MVRVMATRVGGHRFNFLPGQIGHSVAYDLPSLRCFFGAVLPTVQALRRGNGAAPLVARFDVIQRVPSIPKI